MVGPRSNRKPSSKSDHTRPPTRVRASNTATWHPCSSSRYEARKPPNPLPTMTTRFIAVSPQAPPGLRDRNEQRRLLGAQPGPEITPHVVPSQECTLRPSN